MARPDVSQRNAGPRLPNGTFAVSEDYGDPAHGEKVPRCLTCGLPHRSRSQLMVFELRLQGRHAGFYTLCERCFEKVNPPPVADPLDVSDIA